MKKSVITAFLPLLLILALAVCAMPCFAADDMKVTAYTCTDENPVVSVYEAFLPIYDSETDIEITGSRTKFTFFYENIFRNTERWRDFSTAPDFGKLSDTDASETLIESVGDTPAWILSFRENDIYPGTAVISVSISDMIPADTPFSLYRYEADGETVLLSCIAEHMKSDENGCLTLTATEAHTYLLVSEVSGGADLSAFVPTMEITTDADHTILTVILVSGGAVLLALAIYFVIVLQIRKKRKAKAKKK